MLELSQVVHHTAVKELGFFQSRLKNNHFHTLGFDALHDALDAAASKVVASSFHDQAVDANHLGVALENVYGAEVFAGGVAVHNGAHDVLRHCVVVGKQLLGVFGQAVAAVTKTGVVVVVANAGVQAHAVNDLAAVQPVAGGIGVQLVKKRHAHGEVRVGEEFDALGLGAAAQQHFYVLFDCALL